MAVGRPDNYATMVEFALRHRFGVWMDVETYHEESAYCDHLIIKVPLKCGGTQSVRQVIPTEDFYKNRPPTIHDETIATITLLLG